MELSLEQAKEYTNMVRKKSPVVHCITNIVTANDCANILLAAGALPTMAHHPMEVAEVLLPILSAKNEMIFLSSTGSVIFR